MAFRSRRPPLTRWLDSWRLFRMGVRLGCVVAVAAFRSGATGKKEPGKQQRFHA
jgi:hypothetical protein